jgi:pSer/pThr/pTyr-binding forkhead associated (FHA) protein
MDETLQQPDPPERPAGPSTDGPPLRLVLEPSGMVVELTQVDTLIGRHSSADIRLPLPDVSRRHCRILHAAGRWRVVDLNSLNGVFVNDEQVEEAELQHGDRLRIGGFTFAVEVPISDLATKLFPDRSGVSYLPPRRKAS